MASQPIDLNRWLKASLQIESLKPVVDRLMAKAARVRDGSRASVIVGYNTSYALYVHEDLSMNHPRGGQAKYLTTPVYLYSNRILDEIVDFMRHRKKATFSQGLIKGAEFIMKRSIPLVPVDTGRLLMSRFITLEE